MRRRRYAVALAMLVTLASSAWAGQSTLSIKPETIDVNLFFNGATVQVSGLVASGQQVAVLCRGQAKKLELKKKGKVWGVLWMNTAEITFDSLPTLYLASSSAKLDSLASAEVLARLGVGYDALSTRAGNAKEDFHELVKLKEKEGLFAQREGAVKLTPQGQQAQVDATCEVPARTPLQSYQVELFGFRDGKGELLAHRTFQVRQVGAARLITSLAETRGLLYGVLVVVFAIVMGLLTGLVFGLKGKGH